jgi:3-deoxy-D-manno-octulosonate 8-phosphate phosphatase (KDO 8-P phosphatase)
MESKTIIIDVDGCLTDNKVYYTHKGERIKGFHSRDIRAIRELVAAGFEVILLTQSSWPGMEDYAKRTGAFVNIARDKWEWVSRNVQQPYIAVGDDVPDIDVLTFAAKAYCPLDADIAVKKLGNVNVLHSKGGEGVVADLVHILMIKTICKQYDYPSENISPVEIPLFHKDRINTHY